MVILIISIYSPLLVKNREYINQKSSLDTYGIKTGDVFTYQFIDNNSDTEVRLNPQTIVIKNQENLTISILSFNASDYSSANIQANVTNKPPVDLCLCLPYFLELNEMESIVANQSTKNYGNVIYFDSASVVLRMVIDQYQDHKVYEWSYQRKTGVLEYWLKYFVLDNGSIFFTGLKLISQDTYEFTIQTSFASETGSLLINESQSSSNRDNTNVSATIISTTNGFQLSILAINVLLVGFVNKLRKKKEY